MHRRPAAVPSTVLPFALRSVDGCGAGGAGAPAGARRLGRRARRRLQRRRLRARRASARGAARRTGRARRRHGHRCRPRRGRRRAGAGPHRRPAPAPRRTAGAAAHRLVGRAHRATTPCRWCSPPGQQLQLPAGARRRVSARSPTPPRRGCGSSDRTAPRRTPATAWPRCSASTSAASEPAAATALRAGLAARLGLAPERGELPYAHPDGRERRLHVSSSTLRDADGTVLGLVALVSDVTDARRAQEELRASALHDGLTRPAQPDPAARPAPARRRGARGARRRSWSSTSTSSGSSTTPAGTPPATSCWSPWPRACRRRGTALHRRALRG